MSLDTGRNGLVCSGKRLLNKCDIVELLRGYVLMLMTNIDMVLFLLPVGNYWLLLLSVCYQNCIFESFSGCHSLICSDRISLGL